MTAAPELILTAGRIYRPGQPASQPGAVAVAGGRIAAIGDQADVLPLRGPATEIVEVTSGLVLPGFIDAHVHPVQGGLERAACDLSGACDRSGYATVITAFVTALGPDEWVLGGGWSMDSFAGGVPTSAELDGLVDGRPAYLPNRDHHSAWVSSAALQRAGIGTGTPDPPGGRIERDALGRPSGALHESAMQLVSSLVPASTASQRRAGLLTGQQYLHSLGITGWQDAIVGQSWLMPDFYDAYRDTDAAGELTGSVVGALWWDPELGLDQLERLVQRRSEDRPDGRFRATAVKIMLDGVCETHTAALLDGYLGADGRPTANVGLSFLAGDALSAAVKALDANGFQVHLHALGDRAVRDGLDAIEAARAANRGPDRRHHLAHLQVVHPDDVPRFGRLGVTANCQALWACADAPMTDLTVPVLGPERSAGQYPFGSIAAAGGRLALGSDWPVSSADPLAIIQTAVTRAVPGEPDSAPFAPAERIGLAAALTAATHGGVYINQCDTRKGDLAVGFDADLVVLDRDPFAGSSMDIATAQVVATFVDGRPVYRR